VSGEQEINTVGVDTRRATSAKGSGIAQNNARKTAGATHSNPAPL